MTLIVGIGAHTTSRHARIVVHADRVPHPFDVLDGDGPKLGDVSMVLVGLEQPVEEALILDIDVLALEPIGALKTDLRGHLPEDCVTKERELADVTPLDLVQPFEAPDVESVSPPPRNGDVHYWHVGWAQLEDEVLGAVGVDQKGGVGQSVLACHKLAHILIMEKVRDLALTPLAHDRLLVSLLVTPSSLGRHHRLDVFPSDIGVAVGLYKSKCVDVG
mmetsp:Transcript_12838/g.20180  ORF Transcript_12838/g.20180 Transcript_12838/m.20180 type:complete len:218 (-) Transcript_12838:528-1181(-)